MNLKVLLKATSISILAVLVDIITMFALSHYTHYDLTWQLYISSCIKVLFLFVGHNLVTFKGNTNTLMKKALKFFPWEIISLIIIAQLIIYTNNRLDIYLTGLPESTIKSTWYLKDIVHKENDGKYGFDTPIIILCKQLLIILFFLLIELHIYPYIFE
jgi:putative flippase GtrA